MDYKTHRSIRSFLPKEVAPALLESIVATGARASNTGNMQTYSVVISRTQEERAALAPLHFNQPMVLQAPLLLTICADFNRFSSWCTLRGAKPGYLNLMGLLAGTTDAMLFAQNMAVAAEESGLGICYLGTTLYSMEAMCQQLKLPRGVVPIVAMVMGYPAEEPQLTERITPSALIHYGSYQQYTPQQLEAIYRTIEELPANIQYVKENSKPSLAHVFTEVRYRPALYAELSGQIAETLRKQGFEI